MAADTASLIAGAEQYLSSLTDEEFAALVVRVRPPAGSAAPAKPAGPATPAPPAPAAGGYPTGWGV